MHEKLRKALTEVSGSMADMGNGFCAFGMMRRPGIEKPTSYDLPSPFWAQLNDSYEEIQREEDVNEFLFT